MKYAEFKSKVREETERTRTYDRVGDSLYVVRAIAKLSRSSIGAHVHLPGSGTMYEPFVAVVSSREDDSRYRKHKVILGSSVLRHEISADIMQESGTEYLSEVVRSASERQEIPAKEFAPTWYNLEVPMVSVTSARMPPSESPEFPPLVLSYSDNAQGLLLADGYPTIPSVILENRAKF